MSYVRWSSVGHPWNYDSDLYIYESDQGTVCWSVEPCLLDGPHPEPFVAEDAHAMIPHVQAHIVAGHAVPEFVIPRLEIEQGFN